MAGFKIVIVYDQTAQVTSDFKNQENEIKQMIGKLKSAQQQLEGGDWQGKGAKQFYSDMNDMLMPSLNRLANSMQSGADSIKKADDVMNQANEQQQGLYVKIPVIASFKFNS